VTRNAAFVLGLVFGGALGALASCALGCATGSDLAAYSAEQEACVQKATTREESQRCREFVQRDYRARWCDAGYGSFCEGG
jgi:hypothetical protein